MKIHYVLSAYPNSLEVLTLRELRVLKERGQDIYVTSLRRGIPSDLCVEPSRLYMPDSNVLKLLWSTFKAILKGKSVFLSASHWAIMLNLIGKKNPLKILGSGFLIDNLIDQYGDLSDHHFHSHHLFLTTYVTYQIARIRNTTYSLTLQTLSHLYTSRFLKKLLRDSSFLRTTSSELKPHFDLLINNPEKFHLITNGVNTSRLLSPEEKNQKELNLIAVGSLLDKKGFDILIEGCRLLKTYRIPFKCSIVGEGKERGFLESLIRAYQLENEVILTGALHNREVLDLMGKSDMLICPSRSPKRSTRDGLPTVILEAMSLSVPVIATRFGGIPDVVIHEETGLLIPEENYKALTAAVVSLYFNKELRQKVTENAFQLVQSECDLIENVARLELLFKQADQPKN
jgi:glycosyltransferase involved in cell wall biosynthesis